MKYLLVTLLALSNAALARPLSDIEQLTFKSLAQSNLKGLFGDTVEEGEVETSFHSKSLFRCNFRNIDQVGNSQLAFCNIGFKARMTIEKNSSWNNCECKGLAYFIKRDASSKGGLKVVRGKNADRAFENCVLHASECASD